MGRKQVILRNTSPHMDHGVKAGCHGMQLLGVVFVCRDVGSNPPRPVYLWACRGLDLTSIHLKSPPAIPGGEFISCRPPSPWHGAAQKWVGRSQPSRFWRSYSCQDASKSGQIVCKSAIVASKTRARGCGKWVEAIGNGAKGSKIRGGNHQLWGAGNGVGP